MFQGTLDTVWMSGLCNTLVDTMLQCHINFGMLVDTEHTRMCMPECLLYHQHMGHPQIQKKLTSQQLLLVDPTKPGLNLICKTFAQTDVIPKHLLTHDPSCSRFRFYCKTQFHRQQFPGKLGAGVRDTALKTAAKTLTDQQTAGCTNHTFGGIASASCKPSAPAPPSSAR